MQTGYLLLAHEELVVTAVVVPEFEEPDDAPEVEEPDMDELGVEPELDDLPAVEDTFAAAAFASAGSLPVTSCTKIPPELATNIAVAIATTRVRITLIRRLRAWIRSATRPLATAVGSGACRRATGSGRAWLEAFSGVIITSISCGRKCDAHILAGPCRNAVRPG
jgi:hypothetical protein